MVLDSNSATVSRFEDSREVIRARRVSASELEVVEEDFSVWSSLSSAERAFSVKYH